MKVHPHAPADGLLRVPYQINGAHPLHPNYPLLPGDVLTRDPDGTYTKHTGIGMFGFVLSPEDVTALEPVGGQIVMTSWGDPDILASSPSSTERGRDE